MTATPQRRPGPAEAEPLLDDRTVVDIGIPGLTLVHFPTGYMRDSGLPCDGAWSVTWSATDHALAQSNFRTLHAAAHYALRLQRLPEVLEAIAAAAGGGPRVSKGLTKAVRHAEAHAHECDAAYPPGNLIVMGNGPSIVDEDGTTRQFMSRAPLVEWKHEDGLLRCAQCGDPPAHMWPTT